MVRCFQVHLARIESSDPKQMIGLKVEISRFVEEGQPNLVECTFIDAHGQKISIIQKVPVISLEDLDSQSVYPQDTVIPCEVINRRLLHDSEIIEIDTKSPWGIFSVEGESLFDVLPEQLIEFKA